MKEGSTGLIPRATTELGPPRAGLGARVYIGRDDRGETEVICVHIILTECAECRSALSEETL
jgi:hypothetical protein